MYIRQVLYTKCRLKQNHVQNNKYYSTYTQLRSAHHSPVVVRLAGFFSAETSHWHWVVFNAAARHPTRHASLRCPALQQCSRIRRTWRHTRTTSAEGNAHVQQQKLHYHQRGVFVTHHTHVIMCICAHIHLEFSDDKLIRLSWTTCISAVWRQSADHRLLLRLCLYWLRHLRAHLGTDSWQLGSCYFFVLSKQCSSCILNDCP